MHWRRKWQPAPVFLPGESQGWGSLVAAVSGVAQSRTRLKRLSSSSSSSMSTNIYKMQSVSRAFQNLVANSSASYLYWFERASITKYHRWLKQQKFNFSQFWRLEGKIKVLPVLASSEAFLLLQVAAFSLYPHKAPLFMLTADDSLSAYIASSFKHNSHIGLRPN